MRTYFDMYFYLYVKSKITIVQLCISTADEKKKCMLVLDYWRTVIMPTRLWTHCRFVQMFCFKQSKCTSLAWLPNIILAWVKSQMTAQAAITGVIVGAYDFWNACCCRAIFQKIKNHIQIILSKFQISFFNILLNINRLSYTRTQMLWTKKDNQSDKPV